MLGPVPLSEGGASIALDDIKASKSSRLGRSLPVLIAAHNNGQCNRSFRKLTKHQIFRLF